MSAAPKAVLRPDLGQAALRYWESGYSIIPLKPGDNVPLGAALPNGKWKPFQERRPSREQVIEWWQDYPDANIGLITGKINKIAVIDFDSPEAVKEAEAEGLELPKTRVHKTPRGYHHIYQYREGFPQTSDVFPHVDCRSEGGYIAAPPSRRPDGDYSVLYPEQIAEATENMVALLTRKRQSKAVSAAQHDTDAPHWVGDALAQGIQGGARNQEIHRLACYFYGKGHPDDIVEAILRSVIAKSSGDHPYTDSEFRKSLISARQYSDLVRQAGVTEPPAFVDVGDAYRYEWPQHGVTIELIDLTKHRNEMPCTLELVAQPAGAARPVKWVRSLNIMAPTTVASLIKNLETQVTKDIPWNSMINDMVTLAYETYKEGKPAVRMAENMPPEEEEDDKYLLPPLILERGPTMWFGDGGSLKSYLAMGAALDLTEGGSKVLGEARDLRRVLYLDWEAELKDHQRRMRGLCYGQGWDESVVALCDVMYRRCTGALADQVPALRRLIAQHNISFVIIDSVGVACGGDALNQDVASRFMDAVRMLDVGTLLISHVTKAGEDKYPFGSIFWSNLCRCTWNVKAEKQDGEPTVSVGMFHRKYNDIGKQRPVGYEFTFDKGAVKVTATSPRIVPEFQNEASLAERLRRLIPEYGELPTQEIYKMLNADYDTVRTELNRMPDAIARKDGRVTFWKILQKG